MNDDVELIIAEAEESMENAVKHLDQELVHIRAGKADTRLVDSVMVEYYGVMTPLSQVSNISTPDAKTIAIQPWEKSLINDIEKAIMVANLGFNPDNNGEMIRIGIPPLTEERRRDLVKQVKHVGEEAKISIRNSRRDANDHLKKLVKDGLSEDIEKDSEAQVQKLTDKFSKEVDALVEKKEKEVLTV
ncbi:ribosome recycling factor [Saccharicrinis sp. FJH62]|uniref:ribosome recycling factor n=1 Tax=Saccharicrinis sp. FJH62 TaxID=3344657 RepID=UPI0035D4B8AA